MSLNLNYPTKIDRIRTSKSKNISPTLTPNNNNGNNYENIQNSNDNKMNEITISYPKIDEKQKISTDLEILQLNKSSKKQNMKDFENPNIFLNNSYYNYKNKKIKENLEDSFLEDAQKISFSGSINYSKNSNLNKSLRLKSNNIKLKELHYLNKNKMQLLIIDDKVRSNFLIKIGDYKKENESNYQLKWYEILFINLCFFTK